MSGLHTNDASKMTTDNTDSDVESSADTIAPIQPEKPGYYRIEAGSREEAIRQMKQIAKQIWPNYEVVRIAVPDEYWIDLAEAFEDVTDCESEYAAGELIVKSISHPFRSIVLGEICHDLHSWAKEHGGLTLMKVAQFTNIGEFRCPDLKWWLKKPTWQQMSSNYEPVEMPGLWMELCFGARKDFEAVFEKIARHVPNSVTVFVAVVMLHMPTEEDLDRLRRTQPEQPVSKQAKEHRLAATTPEAAYTELEGIAAPIIVVWHLNSSFQEAKYYIVERGLYVDLDLPGVETPFTLKMDNFIDWMLDD